MLEISEISNNEANYQTTLIATHATQTEARRRRKQPEKLAPENKQVSVSVRGGGRESILAYKHPVASGVGLGRG